MASLLPTILHRDAYPLSVAALIFAAVLAAYRVVTRKTYTLKTIPFHKFAENDSFERYVTDSQALLHEGYEKYTKNGIPYQMRNPVDPDHPQVILPWKYLEEVKNAPYSKLSFFLFSRQAFLLDAVSAPLPKDSAAHVTRQDLNKNLPELIKYLQEEGRTALSSKLPECKDWTPVKLYMTIAYTVARMSTRFLVGSELCSNEEWLNLAVSTTITVFTNCQILRKTYPRRWRWLAPYFNPGSKMVYAGRKRAAELLQPVYEKRVQERKEGKKGMDAVAWLIAASRWGRKGMLELADEQLFLTMASIHSTSATVLSTIYDLLDRPHCIPEILEEITTVAKENKNGQWTKQSLFKLEKLDSFMKESQRVNPAGLVTVQRSAVRPYTFKDGFHIPANTQTCFPNYELNHDGDVYDDPETFDPWRFVKMRKAGEHAKFHFAYVNEDSINFGAGFHACPGRFSAEAEIKLILVELLIRFELKYPEGGERPPNMVHDFARTANPMVDILIREKKV